MPGSVDNLHVAADWDNEEKKLLITIKGLHCVKCAENFFNELDNIMQQNGERILKALNKGITKN